MARMMRTDDRRSVPDLNTILRKMYDDGLPIYSILLRTADGNTYPVSPITVDVNGMRRVKSRALPGMWGIGERTASVEVVRVSLATTGKSRYIVLDIRDYVFHPLEWD